MKNIRTKTETLRKFIARREELDGFIRVLRNEIRDSLNLGSHNGFTIYVVKETRVKAHFRKGFKAVRVRK